MKSAREIACTPEMGDCMVGQMLGQPHSAECDARTEAIQQAREDGARWAMSPDARWVSGTNSGMRDPADVRNAGAGDAGNGGT